VSAYPSPMRIGVLSARCLAGPQMISKRRFPPRWSVEETDACFIVRDANGQALAYVYFETSPGSDPRAKSPQQR